MTSGDGTTDATRVCKNPACGREFTPARNFRGEAAQVYCAVPCRRAGERARERERRLLRQPAKPQPRPCKHCGETFTPRDFKQEFCCDAHRRKCWLLRNPGYYAASNAHKAKRTKTRVPPPPPCPKCGAAAKRDGRLAYCPRRLECGWLGDP